MGKQLDLMSLAGIAAENVQVVFLLSTPLQFLNAYEAQYDFGCDPSRTLVVMTDNHTASNSYHMRKLSASQGWQHLLILPTERRRLLARLRLARRSGFISWFLTCPAAVLRKLLGIPLEQLVVGRSCQNQMKELARSLEHLEYLFIGYFGSPIMRHFVNSVRASSTYVLEEGVNQLHLYDDIHAEKPKFARQYYFSPFWNFMKRIFFGVKLRAPKPLQFYTAYDLQETDKVKIRRNTYTKFRESIRVATQSEEVYFLGEWLTAWDCCTDEDYVDFMKQVKGCYPGRQIIYVPHRRTPRRTEECVSQIPDIEVRHLGGPVELVLGAMAERPKTVAAFFSSAIFNLAMLFGDEMELKTFKAPIAYPTHEIEHFIEGFYLYTNRYFSDAVRVTVLKGGGAG
jgi:hypothetical protein